VFGWDNEFEGHQVSVPAFLIDKYKVTNADFAKFVMAGGYKNESLWSPQAWKWIQSANIQCPKAWRTVRYGWVCRTMFGNVPFQPSWPVYVSHAEAEAYTRWKGRALPTEAQFHRAAFGRRDGLEQPFPWGSEYPRASMVILISNGGIPRLSMLIRMATVRLVFRILWEMAGNGLRRASLHSRVSKLSISIPAIRRIFLTATTSS